MREKLKIDIMLIRVVYVVTTAFHSVNEVISDE
jgi:phage shock protein PspC (stress-responsive transcriptional regulator)